MRSTDSRVPVYALTVALLALGLAACGGGGGGGFSGGGSSSSGGSSSGSSSSSSGSSSSSSSSSGGSSSSSSSGSSGAPPTLQQRQAAAEATAAGNAACTGLGPFYWEIGDQSGPLDSASLPSGDTTYTAATTVPIYSASKWLFAAFVAQMRGSDSALSGDIPALTMTSGYVSMPNGGCQPSDTVASCASSSPNGDLTVTEVGRFYYGSGHFQHLGADTSLGIAGDDTTALAAALRNTLGTDVDVSWSTPELAGGAVASANAYGAFLRHVMATAPATPLVMGAELGLHKVCTNCATSDSVPGPPMDTEQWNYSLGHWVEDDPAVGDHAFSSPGFAGFYPWIDASRTWYGLLVRDDASSLASGFTASIACGRLIRKAWISGAAVP